MLFHIHIKAEHADKGKHLQKILILLRGFAEGLPGCLIFGNKICFQCLDLLFLQTEYFRIDPLQLNGMIRVEILLRQRRKQALNIADR